MTNTVSTSPVSPSLPAAEQQELDGLIRDISQKFSIEFDVMDIDGAPLHLLSVTNMTQHIDGLLARKAIHDPLKDLPLWAKVWPASFVLGRFVRKYAPQGKNMLEIGAGCGVTSCIASRYGLASICVSDIVDDALRFARANILRNNLQDICSTRFVDVTRTRLEHSFDIIAASEIIYLDELHRPLLKFVQRHLRPGGQAVFCTDMARRKKHFSKLAAKEFAVEEQMVGVKSTNAQGEEERRVYLMHILEHK